MRSAPGYGSGFRRTASTTANSVAIEAIASESVTTATTANAGVRASERSARRRLDMGRHRRR